MPRALFLASLAGWLVACGSSREDPPPATFCPSGLLASYASIDQKLLKARCAACHDTALARGQLDMSGDAYAALVNVPAQNVAASAPPPGLLRVKPGDAAGSLLWQKLVLGTFSPQYGAGMPQDAPGTVCPAAADAVKQWIDAGAARN